MLPPSATQQGEGGVGVGDRPQRSGVDGEDKGVSERTVPPTLLTTLLWEVGAALAAAGGGLHR